MNSLIQKAQQHILINAQKFLTVEFCSIDPELLSLHSIEGQATTNNTIYATYKYFDEFLDEELVMIAELKHDINTKKFEFIEMLVEDGFYTKAEAITYLTSKLNVALIAE